MIPPYPPTGQARWLVPKLERVARWLVRKLERVGASWGPLKVHTVTHFCSCRPLWSSPTPPWHWLAPLLARWKGAGLPSGPLKVHTVTHFCSCRPLWAPMKPHRPPIMLHRALMDPPGAPLASQEASEAPHKTLIGLRRTTQEVILVQIGATLGHWGSPGWSLGGQNCTCNDCTKNMHNAC
jgi:hypothetical protein